RRRRPVRPLAFRGDMMGARPFEAGPSDAYAISQRLAVAEHVIKPALGGRDDDGPGLFAAGIGYSLTRYGAAEWPPVAPTAKNIGEEIRPRRRAGKRGRTQREADDRDDSGQTGAKGKTTKHATCSQSTVFDAAWPEPPAESIAHFRHEWAMKPSNISSQ